MKQNSAIQNAIEKMELNLYHNPVSQRCNDMDDAMRYAIKILKEALPEEEMQIKEAFEIGFRNGILIPHKINKTSLDYFTETFNTND